MKKEIVQKKFSKDKLRLFTEIIFLLIFTLLFRQRVLQRWIFVFGIGVLLSFIIGRLYCAWVCPIATFFRPINWIYKKLGINRLKTPQFFKLPW